METYYEKQKFNQWWIKLSIFIPFVIVFWGLITGKTQGDNGTSMLIASVVLGFVAVLFYFANLETRIDTEGITIRFFPFQRVYYYVRWNEIQSASVRNYKPIREYGGWGLRYSFTHGKAYNVAGSVGLQLVLKSGKKFLIGTQKEEELRMFLVKLKSENNLTCLSSLN
jgi:hypothetical protein